MANVKRTVDIIFNGKDEVSQVIKGISGNVSQLDYVARNIADPLAGLGKSLLEAEAGLAALTVTGMALAIRESGKFGDSFNEISTLVHTSDENLKQFRANILEYSRTSKTSIDDINSAVYTAISAGIDYAKSLEVINQAEQLAIAGRAELEPTTRLLAATLNAYGASTEEAQRYSDVFFKTVEKGLTTIPELADSLARVTGIAAAGKIPIETLMSAIAALTATGMPTEQAVTGLRAAINNIISPSAEAAKTAKELGLQFNAGAIASKGLEGVLREVYQATGGNVEVMSQLFGNIRALNPALILGADNAGKFKESLEAMQKAAGATEEAYKKMADSFKYINKTLENNYKATMVIIGQKLMEDYRDVAEGIGKILQTIGDAIKKGAFDQIFNALDNFGDQVKDFLFKVAESLPEALSMVDYSRFIDSLGDLGNAFRGLFKDIDLTTPEGLAQAIQEAVNVIEVLNRVTSGIVEFFVDLFNSLREGSKSFNNISEDSQKAFGQILAGAMMVQKAGLVVTTTFLTMQQSGANFEDAFLKTAYGVALSVNSLITIFELLRTSLASNLWLITKIMEIRSFGLSRKAKELNDALGLLIKDSFKNMTEAGGRVVDNLEQMSTGYESVKLQIAESIKENEKLIKELEKMPETITIKMVATWQERFAQIEKEKMQEDFPDSKAMEIIPALDKDSTAKTKEIIKKELPDYRLLEIEAKLNESALREQTERIQSFFEYKAQVDIAQIESATRRVEATFNSMNESIESTGSLIGTLFDEMNEASGAGNYNAIMNQIDLENKRRDEALRLQTELTESQIDYLEARKEAMARGEGLITVQCDGLKPHLEAILWEIVEAAQIRTNFEHGEFLTGI